MGEQASANTGLSGMRVLIVKPSSLGDVVHTVPLVHAIKRTDPSTKIGWIVQEGFAPLLAMDPAVDAIVPINIPSTSDPNADRWAFVRATRATIRTLIELRRQFKAHPYDVVIDLHASFRSGLLGLTNTGGIRMGLANAKELNSWFQHITLPPPADSPHAVDENLVFARELGCSPIPEDFRLMVSPDARRRVAGFLQNADVRLKKRLVYANPVARWETKLWTVEHWARTADLLTREADATVVFAGAPGDLPYIDSIVQLMREPAIIAAAAMGLSDAVALAERCDAYVGVDSGPMHIAAFVDTPVVALFGPTDPRRVGPYGDGHVLVRRDDLDCLGCRKRSCAKRDCMEKLDPDRVVEATVRLLKAREQTIPAAPRGLGE